jgi:hypothetical protein
VKTIPAQLVDIYFNEEWWHKNRMTYLQAFDYHKTRYENGTIYTYEEKGEVLGYYERYIQGNTCILYNIWIKESLRRGRVFKELYRHFFATLPIQIDTIVGEKQKLGGKFQRVKIGGRNG